MALQREDVSRKRVVQHERSAGEKPGKNPACETRPRCNRRPGNDPRVGAGTAERGNDSGPGGREPRMAARQRNDAIGHDFESNRRDMVGAIAPAFFGHGGGRRGEDVVE